MYDSNGILIIHDSPIRAPNFETRKMTCSFARIEIGIEDALYFWQSLRNPTGDTPRTRPQHAEDIACRRIWRFLSCDPLGTRIHQIAYRGELSSGVAKGSTNRCQRQIRQNRG